MWQHAEEHDDYRATTLGLSLGTLSLEVDQQREHGTNRLRAAGVNTRCRLPLLGRVDLDFDLDRRSGGAPVLVIVFDAEHFARWQAELTGRLRF